MTTLTSPLNNDSLLQIVLNDSMKFQADIKSLTQEIQDLKVKLRKSQMENGSMIIKINTLVTKHKTEIAEQASIRDQIDTDYRIKISNLEEEIAKIKSAMQKVHIENGRLVLKEHKASSDLGKIKMEYEQYKVSCSANNEKILTMQKTIDELNQNNSMLSKTCVIMIRQQREYTDKKKELLDQIKQLQEELLMTQARERQFTYDTIIIHNKSIEEIAQLKEFNRHLIDELNRISKQ